ncbi:hypothetical protein [Priestia megaterium]|uniref:hypothetical protein n=1 Tax=Priestia megaterium TaxID=1404 RepID=UPI002877F185|nr:hypothetical protein [Priestia megaterium]
MRARQRIIKLEKILPTTGTDQDENEVERICSWLAQYNEEFVECVRQLYRLQYKTGQHTDNWDQWQEPYKQHASLYLNRINELIEEHKRNVGP